MGIKYKEQEQLYRRGNWTLHILVLGDGHTKEDWRRTNAVGYQRWKWFLLKYVPVAPFILDDVIQEFWHGVVSSVY